MNEQITIKVANSYLCRVKPADDKDTWERGVRLDC